MLKLVAIPEKPRPTINTEEVDLGSQWIGVFRVPLESTQLPLFPPKLHYLHSQSPPELTGDGRLTWSGDYMLNITWASNLMQGPGSYCLAGGNVMLEAVWAESSPGMAEITEFKKTAPEFQYLIGAAYFGPTRHGLPFIERSQINVAKTNGWGYKWPGTPEKSYSGTIQDFHITGFGVQKRGLVKYEGPFKLGRFHTTKGERYGRLKNPDGGYDGEWENGVKKGKGTYRKGDTVIVGEFEDKKLVNFAYAESLDIDGNSYSGGLWQGKPDTTTNNDGVIPLQDRRPAKLIYQNTDEYNGHFLNGERHGDGELKQANNFIYSGGWRHNAMHGDGVAKYPNGEEYSGRWVDGHRDGRGVLSQGDRQIYDGRWQADLYDGYGVLDLGNGQSYEGDFVDGLYHGSGDLTEDEFVYQGRFTKGQKHDTMAIETKRDDNTRYRVHYNRGVLIGERQPV